MRSYDVEMVPTDNGPWCLKSEADKVITHQKYKRCMAMARWCRSRACFYDTMREGSLYWAWKSDKAYKWYKRWLQLADKFKE